MFYFVNNKLVCGINDQLNTKDSVQIDCLHTDQKGNIIAIFIKIEEMLMNLYTYIIFNNMNNTEQKKCTSTFPQFFY